LRFGPDVSNQFILGFVSWLGLQNATGFLLRIEMLADGKTMTVTGKGGRGRVKSAAGLMHLGNAVLEFGFCVWAVLYTPQASPCRMVTFYTTAMKLQADMSCNTDWLRSGRPGLYSRQG
jgi:hypothetical protein